MVEQLQNSGGLGHTLPINPLVRQQQPPPEQQDQSQTPPPADGVELPEDRVSLSGRPNEDQGRNAAAPGEKHPAEGASRKGAPGNKVPGEKASKGNGYGDVASEADEAINAASKDDTLDSEEEELVRDLKQRDAEVKAHEQAHMAAGGGLVQGAAGYTYEKGPDGGMYAVGGEVKIDTSPAKDPDQTIAKMQQVRRAALAPAQPSSTDRSVAAQASQVEAQARSEKASEAAEGDKQDPTDDVARAARRPTTEETGEEGAPTQATATSPFTVPAIQAYQAVAASQTRQQFSTFA